MDFYSLLCDSCGDKRARAERDLWRLKSNWVFVIFACIVAVINYICVIPTNHQFIINPTAETLRITDEKVEPGLEQSEAFYSLTYVVLFVGYTLGAMGAGLLFNLIPTWYLFLVSTLCHTLGYLLYALATNGWMMLLARGLAGLQQGSIESLMFSYFAISFEKYTENLKTLGKYEEKKAAKVKGYLFSTTSIAYVIGFGIGVGFPVILAQFPEAPQFRPAGWFCVAAGVTLLLLQLLLFHGECAWQCSNKKIQDKCSIEKLESTDQPLKTQICQILVPLYVILTGGLKGIRYLLLEVLLNPIISDSFGFSAKDTTVFFLICFYVCPSISAALLYFLQYFNMKSYGLTTWGLVCTIVSLLILTDWQAIGSDPCTEYSLFHHPQLADQYRLQLAQSNVSESGMVSIQSLQVVEDEVYQMAVNRCESAGEHCHWIPNSLVTHEHCSDCQPICRNPQHTLNFIQFIVGIGLYFSTTQLMYSGVYWLLSDTVSKKYQGVSTGSASALMGISRSIFPYILDAVYENQHKQTYLPMLIQVGIYLPLLVGLLLLYPWLAGSHKINYSQPNEDTEEGERDTNKLLSSQ